MAVPAIETSAPKIPKALYLPIEALACPIPRAPTAPPSGEGRNFRPVVVVESPRTWVRVACRKSRSSGSLR